MNHDHHSHHMPAPPADSPNSAHSMNMGGMSMDMENSTMMKVSKFVLIIYGQSFAQLLSVSPFWIIQIVIKVYARLHCLTCSRKV